MTKGKEPVFVQDYHNRFMDRNTNDPYARGQQDYVDGKKLKDCPFPRGKDAMKWRKGWWDQESAGIDKGG